MPRDVRRKLSAALRDMSAQEPIAVLYLYGSYAGGVTDSESDVDIAILADASLSREQRFDLRVGLYAKLAKALKVPDEKLDIIILQDAPPLLKYNVIRKGVCVFERNRSERNLFELKVEQEYDDERYYLEREGKLTLDRVLSLS